MHIIKYHVLLHIMYINCLCMYFICVGVKFRNRIVNEGFTGSKTPHRNNRPSPRT